MAQEMPVTGVRDLANIEYGGFYIPVVTWLYLYSQTPNHSFIYFIGVSVIGVVTLHSIARSIFGYEGPRVNPKKNWTVIGYIFAFMYVQVPGRNPDTVDELVGRIVDAFTLRRGLRFLFFFSFSSAYFFLMLYSVWKLYQFSFTGSPDLVAGSLFLLQLVFLVQGQIMDRFAVVVPPENAEWVYVPEFCRVNEKFGEDEYPDWEYRDPPLIVNEFWRFSKELDYERRDEEMMENLDLQD